MQNQKLLKEKTEPSEVLNPVIHLDFKIKTIKHANTGLTLYRFPSKSHNWENCWTTDIETAKTGIAKYFQHMKKFKGKNK
tara:strand:+ start:1282 stop:1521 length:240 start_codon:yes stop_codon:yes gene_type:complete